MKRQDSAEARRALSISPKIKEDSSEHRRRRRPIWAAASESEAEAGLKAMNGLRRASSEVEDEGIQRATKVMREVAREDNTDQILRKAALDVSADDAANTLKKVVAFQSDSEDDDVREAPAPAPERFDGDSDDSRLEDQARSIREKRSKKTRFAGTRYDFWETRRK